MNVKRALGRRIDVRSKHGSRWVLENSLGVRVADFHPGPEHEMRILRPGNDLLFLRRVASEHESEAEYAIPTAAEVVSLAELESAPPRVAMRGAAHESFSLIFSMPFDAHAVESYRAPERAEPAPRAARTGPARDSWRRPAGISVLGLSAAAAATGAALWVSGEAIRKDGESGVSQRDIAERNDRVADRRLGAYIAFSVAGVAAGAGVSLLLWPTKTGGELSASARPSGVALTWRPR